MAKFNLIDMTIDNNLPAVSYRQFLMWLLGKRRRYQVAGNSMLPWLQPNEEILVAPKAYQKTLPLVGDIVVLNHPHNSELILVKRVAAVNNCGNCFLVGDNLAESTDSRHWGKVKSTILLGKAVSRF